MRARKTTQSGHTMTSRWCSHCQIAGCLPESKYCFQRHAGHQGLLWNERCRHPVGGECDYASRQNGLRSVAAEIEKSNFSSPAASSPCEILSRPGPANFDREFAPVKVEQLCTHNAPSCAHLLPRSNSGCRSGLKRVCAFSIFAPNPGASFKI